MEVAINMKTAAMVWWAIMWRCFVFCTGIGMVAGFAVGVAGRAVGIDVNQHENFLRLLGAGIGIAVSIMIVHRLMEKGFGRYRLSLKLRES
jgi:hypothetical protein